MFQVTIDSDRSFLSRLPTELRVVREACEMSELAFHNLVVVVTEGVVNAIVHGNREDPEKRVRIEVACSDEGVRGSIEDEGEGFALEDAPDPISPENLLREGGRGVFIIRALTLACDVEKTPTGSRLTFLLDRDPGRPGDEGEEE